MLLLIGIVAVAFFVASVFAVVREDTGWCFLQLAGASFLIVVVLAHVAEAFKLLPFMGWGQRASIGHYIDLMSAAAGAILLLAGYLGRHRKSGAG